MENTENSIAKHTYSKPKRTGRKIVVLVAIILLITGMLVSGYLIYKNYTAKKLPVSSKQSYAKEFLDSDNSSATKEALSEKYSSKYSESLQSTSGTDPAQWNKQKVNDACITLLFVNKMGSYSQALQYLALLDEAKSSGINIDDNDYGVNQKVRDEIYAKSKQAYDKALGGVSQQ